MLIFRHQKGEGGIVNAVITVLKSLLSSQHMATTMLNNTFMQSTLTFLLDLTCLQFSSLTHFPLSSPHLSTYTESLDLASVSDMWATTQVNKGATSVHCGGVCLHLLIDDAHLCVGQKCHVRGQGYCSDIFYGTDTDMWRV